jgi:pteridine reductase
MNIRNKVAIVTGSAKRVGKAIALTLAKRGANVVVHYHSSVKDAQKTVDEISRYGVKAFAIKADLSSIKGTKRIVDETLKHFGRIDILVNSASIYEKTPLNSITEQNWDRHLNTNLKNVFFLSRECAKVMQKQKSGKIINIIDSDIIHPRNQYLPYTVSKSGLVGLTYCLAKELAPDIQVNGIAPGPILFRKNMPLKMKQNIILATPLKRIGSPIDIANTVLFCVEGTDFMTGAIIPIDGGQHIA